MSRFLLRPAIALVSASTGMAETISITGQNGDALNGTRTTGRGYARTTTITR